MATFARSRKRRRKRRSSRPAPSWSVRGLPLGLIAASLLAPIVYVLGRWEVIDTRTAIAIAALVLLAALLYFPLRYHTRLAPGGQALAWIFALIWFVALTIPVLSRIYPLPAIAAFEIQPAEVPYLLPAAIHGADLEMRITGHLREGQPHATRNGRWRMRIQPPEGPPLPYQGSLRQSWGGSPHKPGGQLELRQSRVATIIHLPPLAPGSRVTSLQFSGQAEPRLTIVARPSGRMGLGWRITVGLLLLLGAATYDRASGAGRTASSLTIVTGAALVSTVSLQAFGSADATFRELFGAVVAGALMGGPLGGLAAWILGARKDTSPKGSRK